MLMQNIIKRGRSKCQSGNKRRQERKVYAFLKKTDFSQKRFRLAEGRQLYYNNIKSKCEEETVMKVSVDESRCIGCGMCAYTAAGVFQVIGKYSNVIAQPEKHQEAKTKDAANGCPVNAISVEK